MNKSASSFYIILEIGVCWLSGYADDEVLNCGLLSTFLSLSERIVTH